MAIATRYPSSNTAVSGTWSNPTNAYVANGSVASITRGTTKNSSDSRIFGNFGFDGAIPAGATINSVAVEVSHRVQTTNNVCYLENLLRINSTEGATNSDGAEPTTLTARSYTSYARPGGGAWTRADLLDGVLTAVLIARNGNNNTSNTWEWDYVRVVVDYTLASQNFAPDVATATGTAYVPTIVASGDAPFAPAVATATGAAYDPTIAASGSVNFAPTTATATGTAYDATIDFAASPQNFAPDTATAVANPTGTGGYVATLGVGAIGTFAIASGVGGEAEVSYDVTITATGSAPFNPATATATGTAYDASVTATGSAPFLPATASATGTSYDVTITATGSAPFAPTTATSSGTAYDVTLAAGGQIFTPDTATSTGTAYDVTLAGTGTATFTVSTATGVATAYDATISSESVAPQRGRGKGKSKTLPFKFDVSTADTDEDEIIVAVYAAFTFLKDE